MSYAIVDWKLEVVMIITISLLHKLYLGNNNHYDH